jgi:hypothetical protein
METDMGLFDKLDRHADLVNRMAETVGADLGDAAIRGQIRPEEMRSAVLRCTACDSVEECGHWLDDHAEGAAAAPGYCRNKATLDRLAKL